VLSLVSYCLLSFVNSIEILRVSRYMHIVQVRRWLDRQQRQKKERYVWQRPDGLTEERRNAIQAKIHEWRESHTVMATA